MSVICPRRLSVVVALTSAVWPIAGRADRQTLGLGGNFSQRLDRLFAAYSAGDDAVLRRSLTRPNDFPFDRNQLDEALRSWRRDWRPVRAMFLFDLMIRTSEIAPGSMTIVVPAAAAFMSSRPAGAPDPALDLFESRWHRATVAFLERFGEAPWLQLYLDGIEGRFGTAGPRPAWLSFARAIALAQRCCPRALYTPRRMSDADAAIALFEAAARAPDRHDESLVRGAMLQLQAGRAAEAFTLVDGASGALPDQELRYWRQMVRGLVFDALQRPAEAADAYRGALEAWPQAHSASLRLASVYARAGRMPDAVDLSLALVTAPRTAFDPWWAYDEADARFYARWRAELVALK